MAERTVVERPRPRRPRPGASLPGQLNLFFASLQGDGIDLVIFKVKDLFGLLFPGLFLGLMPAQACVSSRLPTSPMKGCAPAPGVKVPVPGVLKEHSR